MIINSKGDVIISETIFKNCIRGIIDDSKNDFLYESNHENSSDSKIDFYNKKCLFLIYWNILGFLIHKSRNLQIFCH